MWWVRPASNEPNGLSRENGGRPDGVNLKLWFGRKPLAWDVTVPDTFPAFHIRFTSTFAFAAADKVSINKTSKFDDLATTHQFVSAALQDNWRISAGCPKSIEFIEDHQRASGDNVSVRRPTRSVRRSVGPSVRRSVVGVAAAAGHG